MREERNRGPTACGSCCYAVEINVGGKLPLAKVKRGLKVFTSRRKGKRDARNVIQWRCGGREKIPGKGRPRYRRESDFTGIFQLNSARREAEWPRHFDGLRWLSRLQPNGNLPVDEMRLWIEALAQGRIRTFALNGLYLVVHGSG